MSSVPKRICCAAATMVASVLCKASTASFGGRIPRATATSPLEIAGDTIKEGVVGRASSRNASRVLFILDFFAAFALATIRFA